MQYFFILIFFVKACFKDSDNYIPIDNNSNIPHDKSNFVADNHNLDDRTSKYYVEMEHIFNFHIMEMDNNINVCETRTDTIFFIKNHRIQE